MPILRPSGSDFTSFVKAAAQYVPAGAAAKASKSGGVSVAKPGLGAVVRTSQVGALASPTTSAVVINGVTPPAVVPAVPTWVNGGVVTTLATLLNNTQDVAVSQDGTRLYVVAGANVYVVTYPGGVVTSLAGNGNSGYADGTGTDAMFRTPGGIAVLPNGNLVVADTWYGYIRLVTYPGGVVTTLAGNGAYGSVDGTGASAGFAGVNGIAALPNGNIVVSDGGGQRIRLITTATYLPNSGVVTTLAGSGSTGSTDGTGTGATFNQPIGIAVLPNGAIVVADSYSQRIRMVTTATYLPNSGVVTTLAGSSLGFADGTGTAANFIRPKGIDVLPNGNLIVSDTDNNRIRLIKTSTYLPNSGVVTTLAGSGIEQYLDGTGVAAGFRAPMGIAALSNGSIAVAGNLDNTIRLIT